MGLLLRKIHEPVRVPKSLAETHPEVVPALSDVINRCLAKSPAERYADMSELDEAFHATLVAAAGNRQLSRMHGEIAERIRIIRRLDFFQPERIRATYQEHAQILRHVLRRQADSALLLLRSHIAASKSEVRKITLHMLYEARRDHPAAQTG